jgi:hypothetical protein
MAMDGFACGKWGGHEFTQKHKKKQQGNCLRQVGATDLPAAGNQNPRPIFAAGKSLWLTLVHSVAHIP